MVSWAAVSCGLRGEPNMMTSSLVTLISQNHSLIHWLPKTNKNNALFFWMASRRYEHQLQVTITRHRWTHNHNQAKWEWDMWSWCRWGNTAGGLIDTKPREGILSPPKNPPVAMSPNSSSLTPQQKLTGAASSFRNMSVEQHPTPCPSGWFPPPPTGLQVHHWGLVEVCHGKLN